MPENKNAVLAYRGHAAIDTRHIAVCFLNVRQNLIMYPVRLRLHILFDVHIWCGHVIYVCICVMSVWLKTLSPHARQYVAFLASSPADLYLENFLSVLGMLWHFGSNCVMRRRFYLLLWGVAWTRMQWCLYFTWTSPSTNALMVTQRSMYGRPPTFFVLALGRPMF